MLNSDITAIQQDQQDAEVTIPMHRKQLQTLLRYLTALNHCARLSPHAGVMYVGKSYLDEDNTISQAVYSLIDQGMQGT